MRLKKSAALLALCAIFGGMAAAQNIKRDFDPVLKLQGDREKFIEAVRTFDRAQNYMAQADQMIAEQYIAEDKRNLANSKLKKANERIKNVRELYQIALKTYPDSALLHNYYGELLYDRYGDIPGALMEWNKAISYDTSLSQAYNNIGLHEVHSGNYSSGLRNLEKALELDKKNPDYLYNMAQIYLVHWPQVERLRGMDTEKVYKEAMKMSKEAAEIAADEFDLVVDYAVNFFAGEGMLQQVNWKAAAKAWETARNVARTSDETFYTWLNEARVWIKQDNAEEAVRCLREALKIRPESALTQQLLNEQTAQPQAAPQPEPDTTSATEEPDTANTTDTEDTDNGGDPGSDE